MTRRLVGLVIAGLVLSNLVAASRAEEEDAGRAASLEEPFAVVAIAGVDRLLDDVDGLFNSVDQPNYALFARGFLEGLNGLRGIDRQCPAGMMVFLRPDQSEEPQPLFFVPVTETKELMKTVRFGKSLRLHQEEATGRLTVQADKGEFPVGIHHGFAFIDATRRDDLVEASIADPVALLGDELGTQDAVVLLRREGVPAQIFERALRDLQESTDKEQERQPGESEAEYEVRREVTDFVFDLIRSGISEWRSAKVGLTAFEDQQTLTLQADIQFERDGELSRMLAGISTGETRFLDIAEAEAPLTVLSSLSLPRNARGVLETILNAARQQVDSDLKQADAASRNAVIGVMDAIERTVQAGRVDAFCQMAGEEPGAFSLVGGVAITDAEQVSQGLRHLLPFAGESADIQDVTMNVGNIEGIPVHRLRPARLRREDRRLYGEEAAFYLAAGKDVFWVAVGGAGAIPALESGMRHTRPPRKGSVIARPPSPGETADAVNSLGGNHRPLLEVTIHAAPWLELDASGDLPGSPELLSSSREVFQHPGSDRVHIQVRAANDGVSLRVDFAKGFLQLLGQTLVSRLQNR